MKNDTVAFKCFESCIPVQGKNRSIICDLQRRTFKFIPNILYEILKRHDGEDIESVKNEYDIQYHKIIDEYFDFLAQEEFIFFTNTPDLFPPIKLSWKSSQSITNAIIDINTKSNKLDIHSFIKQSSTLGCQHIQVRIYESLSIAFIEELLKPINDTVILSLELILAYDQSFTNKTVLYFLSLYPSISSIVLHTVPNYDCFVKIKGNMNNIFYSKQSIDINIHCGVISPYFFSINLQNFTESQHHNTCLNRKISIDTEGNIKNCPSMQQSFGHISNTTLENVIQDPAFTKVWNIKKDEIEKCKACEFRHICTDCRAYLENPNDVYSAPLKCGYNPETCEWENWSTNPLKEKAIDYYQLQTTS